MPETEPTYPSNYAPGRHWAWDEAWAIVDSITPGVLSEDLRAWLAGCIVGTLMRVVREREAGRQLPSLHHVEDTP